MSNIFLGQKNLGQINFLGRKNFWVKNFWLKKIWHKKIFGSEKKISKKKGRVNPRGRIYDSPPENSRVKILLGRS